MSGAASVRDYRRSGQSDDGWSVVFQGAAIGAVRCHDDGRMFVTLATSRAFSRLPMAEQDALYDFLDPKGAINGHSLCRGGIATAVALVGCCGGGGATRP